MDSSAFNKQAYLIIAHSAGFTFRTLLSVLDDKRNDIHVHMDAKNKRYSIPNIEKIVKDSNIFMLNAQV